MKSTASICARDCYDTCSLVVTLNDSQRILSVRGDGKHPVTRGFTCPRGARDHERITTNRVQAPVIRRANRFQRVGWEEGLDVISHHLSDTLKTHGPEAVLYLDYAGNMGLLSNTFPRRLWNAIGATQTDWALCSNSGHQGLALHYGSSYGLRPTEIASMDLVIFWGFNAAVSSPHLWALAKKARTSKGTQLIVIDPRKTRTARSADLWIRPDPGTDVVLAYGVIAQLIRKGHVDLSFIEKWTHGFEQLKKATDEWSTGRVTQVTGVDGRLVEQLADAYGLLKPSATMIGIGLQKCGRGADQVRAASLIPACVGLHRGFFYGNSSAFTVDNSLVSGRSLTTRPPRIVSQVSLADLVEIGRFKFIYISCMNPAMTLPNLHAFRSGLARRDVFVAVHETHWTKTAQCADVVLPAPTHLEKEDLVIPWAHDYVRCSGRAAAPLTDSRSEFRVMRELARRLDLTESWLYENPWHAVEKALKDALESGGFRSLKAGKTMRLKSKPKNRYPTPSQKIEFVSSTAADRGVSPLPVPVVPNRDNRKFILLTSASPEYTSTQFQEVYGKIPATVTINIDDARRQGIQKGDVVTLASNLGKIQLTAIPSDTVPPGVLWSPRQSEGLNEEPLNGLMSSTPQKIGGGPRFNSTRVTITAS